MYTPIQAQHRGRVARQAPPLALAAEVPCWQRWWRCAAGHTGHYGGGAACEGLAGGPRMGGGWEAELSRASANIDALLALARRP